MIKDIGIRDSGFGIRARRTGVPDSIRNSGAAFTLIELLLVLVILGVLAVLVVPRFTGTAERAKKQAASTQIETFKMALGRFEVDCGKFPTTDEGLKALIEQPSSVKGWQGPYLDSVAVPRDPWGNPYMYRQPGTHRPDFYDVYSTGTDGNDSGGENINNWTQK
jgi:general secretion pathway protein G